MDRDEYKKVLANMSPGEVKAVALEEILCGIELLMAPGLALDKKDWRARSTAVRARLGEVGKIE